MTKTGQSLNLIDTLTELVEFLESTEGGFISKLYNGRLETKELKLANCEEREAVLLLKRLTRLLHS